MIKEAELDPKADGQIPILAQDYLDGDSICKGEPVYVSALVKRGTTDVDMDENVHIMYGHPIDGLVAHVDLTNRKLLKLVDTDHTHIPMESVDYLDPKVTGTTHNCMKPQHIKQPGGGAPASPPRTTSCRARPGRSASASWPRGPHAARHLVQRPRPIHYLDATVVDDFYEPFVIKNATFMYEEDFGTLWKHTDVLASPPTGTMRRQHRFVVSFFVTVGSYRYGFYWYFYLDGRDELDCGHGYQMDCGHDYQMDD
ncbi:hypothetical protein PF005_g15564 [Phytophthora fragariae]|uniref:Amine oxidase n=1 Tax=Phytophthora fragariae TaxID=53985 RepID=A0A6A3ELU2_9STRA|nr:hypothetical protein PF009_g16598 [Phytophthora fragariae]KAE8999472.1 hypothetical protein PF011_g14616 [Phytophthora fragariae]KAE9098953.1 hypothetical protein PF007_g16067 [Phytophthora fragariae]KAE9199881.1 hypothetical protein PF005_g15564 [Phytophthora fragariae]